MTSAIMTAKARKRSSDAMSGDPAVNAIAGASAAGAVLCGLFPIDSIKTQMQAKGTPALVTVRSQLLADAPWSRIYRGLAPALAEQMLNRSMLFGVGALMKRHVVPKD